MENEIQTSALILRIKEILRPAVWSFRAFMAKIELKLRPFFAQKIDPLTLLDFRRFDFAAKYIYAWFLENKIESDWGHRVYKEHLRVDKNFLEPNPPKIKFEDYDSAFKIILEKTKADVLNTRREPVPVRRDGYPENGSHRIAAAIFYKKKIYTYRIRSTSKIISDFRHFSRDAFVPNGLTGNYKDAIAYEYCKLKKNARIAVIFPAAARNEAALEEKFEKYGNIFFQKKTRLSVNGILNLIKQTYSEAAWLSGEADGYKEARAQAEACFAGEEPLQIYGLDFGSEGKNWKCKNEIRKMKEVKSPAFYMTDSQKETLDLAGVLFNENSLEFLEKTPPDSLPRNFEKIFSIYRNSLKSEKNPEYFCVTGEAAMAVYGLEDSSRLDYFYFKEPLKSDGADIRGENSDADAKKIHNILFNPENHFYFRGLKFAAVKAVKEFSEK